MYKKLLLLLALPLILSCGRNEQRKNNTEVDVIPNTKDSTLISVQETKNDEPIISRKTVNVVYKSTDGNIKTSFSIPVINSAYPALKETLSEKNLLGESLDDIVANFKSCGCGTTKFDFDVTYESSEIVSLILSTEGLGAYSSSSTAYLTLNVNTGKPVSLNNEINSTGLNWMLNSYKKTLLQRAEERQKELAGEAETDSTDLGMDEFASTLTSDIKSLTAESLSRNYAFTKDGITIYSDPVLPHVALALEPDRVVTFKYNDLFPYQTATSIVLRQKMNE